MLLSLSTRRPPQGRWGTAAVAGFVAGGLLVWWSAAIHLHLWLSFGYRHIATIGPLFLLQAVAGIVLGALVVAVHRLWTAVLGLGLVASTAVGLAVAVEHGLFGFRDSWAAPFALQSLVTELIAVVVLASVAAVCALAPAAAPPPVTEAARSARPSATKT